MCHMCFAYVSRMSQIRLTNFFTCAAHMCRICITYVPPTLCMLQMRFTYVLHARPLRICIRTPSQAPTDGNPGGFWESTKFSRALVLLFFLIFVLKNDRATTRPCWGGSKGISRHFWLTAKVALIQKPYILTLMATLPINVTLATHARDDPTPGGPIRLPLRDA